MLVLRRRPIARRHPSPASTWQGPAPRFSGGQFAARYGVSPGDVRRVTQFAVHHGLTVEEVHLGRRVVMVSGTVAKFERAFWVELHLYQVPKAEGVAFKPGVRRTYVGRAGFIHLPHALTGIVLGVFGLETPSIGLRNATNGDPPNTQPLTVPDVARLYNFPPGFAAGQTIGIISNAGYQPQDIQCYFGGLNGYQAPIVMDVPVSAFNNNAPDFETTQDICVAGTVAQGAQIAVYFTANDSKSWLALLQRIVHPDPGDPVCTVICSSFAFSTGDAPQVYQSQHLTEDLINAMSAVFHDAYLQHITVCVASGDRGSDSASGVARVQYPASDPWVLSCGGTTVGNVNGASFQEYVWNDAFNAPGGQSGGSGGGVSDFFRTLPDYQTGVGIPTSINDSHVGRGVPDVAANASPNSGYRIRVGGRAAIANGTSVAAPLYAGLIALLNAQLGWNVGFINGFLYAQSSRVVRPVSSPPGPADNGLNGTKGYPATRGWNACTGLGVIDGTALLAALRNAHGPNNAPP